MQPDIHVFVEKPMATRYAGGLAMVRTAEEHGVALGVSFFRRLMPGIRLLKSMVAGEWLGRPIGSLCHPSDSPKKAQWCLRQF
jgi:predicted dehydrogenase